MTKAFDFDVDDVELSKLRKLIKWLRKGEK